LCGWHGRRAVVGCCNGAAAEGGIAGGVNEGGTGIGATIERIGGIHDCREEESDTDCDDSKLGYGKVASTN
jgi:hypothetical protein